MHIGFGLFPWGLILQKSNAMYENIGHVGQMKKAIGKYRACSKSLGNIKNIGQLVGPK